MNKINYLIMGSFVYIIIAILNITMASRAGNQFDNFEVSEILEDFEYVNLKFENLKKIECMSKKIKKKIDDVENKIGKIKKDYIILNCKKNEFKSLTNGLEEKMIEKSNLLNEILNIDKDVKAISEKYQLDDCNENENEKVEKTCG